MVTRAEVFEHLISGANIHGPLYPPLARQARIQGAVELTLSIDEEGNVTDVEVVSGHPMLRGSAVENVKHWKFRPFTEDDEPIAVAAPLTINFSIEISPEERRRNFNQSYSWKIERASKLLAEGVATGEGEAGANAKEALTLAHAVGNTLAEAQAEVLLARILEADHQDGAKDFEAAQALFRQARSEGRIDDLNSDWTDADFYAGRNYFSTKNYSLAEPLLQSALRNWLAAPSSTAEIRIQIARTANMLATANLKLGRLKAAREACNILIREKRALHGLELDEAMQPCAWLH